MDERDERYFMPPDWMIEEAMQREKERRGRMPPVKRDILGGPLHKPAPGEERVFGVKSITEPGEERSHGKGIVDMLPVLFEYANIIKKDIYYDIPHGSSTMPYKSVDGDKLFIRFWSQPEKYTSTHIAEVFGLGLIGGQMDASVPTPRTKEKYYCIYDGDCLLAMVADDTLYILFDLTHGPNPNNASIMRELMEEYTCVGDEERREMRKKASQARLTARVPQVLKTLMEKPIQEQMLSIDKRLADAELNVDNYQQMLLEWVKKKASLDKDKVVLAELSAKGVNAERELETIRNLPLVKRITTHGDYLIVETDVIYISTDVAKYQIGRFRIEFGPNRYFVIHNMDKGENGISYDHPHIRNGQPCLGNYSDMMVNAYNGEIATTMILCLEFLQSYTTGAAFVGIENWKVVERLEPTVVGTPVDDEVPSDDETQPSIVLTPRDDTRRLREVLADALEEAAIVIPTGGRDE